MHGILKGDLDRERCSNMECCGVKRKEEKKAKENGKEQPEKESQESEVSWKNVFQSRESGLLCQMLLKVK